MKPTGRRQSWFVRTLGRRGDGFADARTDGCGRAPAARGGPSGACDRCDRRRHSVLQSSRERTAAGALSSRGRASGRETKRGSSTSTAESVSSVSTGRASPSGAGPVRTDASSSRPAPIEDRSSLPSRPYAWARRNSDQLGPRRRGAGPRPDLRNTVAIVVAETLIPSFSSSPSMRM